MSASSPLQGKVKCFFDDERKRKNSSKEKSCCCPLFRTKGRSIGQLEAGGGGSIERETELQNKGSEGKQSRVEMKGVVKERRKKNASKNYNRRVI